VCFGLGVVGAEWRVLVGALIDLLRNHDEVNRINGVILDVNLQHADASFVFVLTKDLVTDKKMEFILSLILVGAIGIKVVEGVLDDFVVLVHLANHLDLHIFEKVWNNIWNGFILGSTLVSVHNLLLRRKTFGSIQQPSQIGQTDLVALVVVTLSEYVLVDLPKHLSHVDEFQFHNAKRKIDPVQKFIDLISNHLMNVKLEQCMSVVYVTLFFHRVFVVFVSARVEAWLQTIQTGVNRLVNLEQAFGHSHHFTLLSLQMNLVLALLV
jgi:hypothetical protein